MMRTALLGMFCFACTGNLHAQQFGANPPYTKWKQINSDTARIIFPAGLDSTASNVASYISYVSKINRPNIGSQLKKIDIVLQNQTVTANGYVGLGPFRSEFYITPPADNFDQGSMYWPLQLSLHEYRHVQQYNNFNNGLSAVMRRLFGQDGYTLAINAAIPNWFFEGDAVFQETALSNQGRGRIPAFLKAYPSLWTSGKNYSWMKLRNGSLKNYVPDHYDLGYLLVNYGVEKYGYDFWRKVTHDASAYNGLFYPMQHAIEKYSGLKYTGFIQGAFDYYKKLYGVEKNGSDTDLYRNNIFALNKKTLTNYYYPFQVSENELIYQKTSNKNRPAFYLKDASGEHLIRYRDISMDNQFSYRNGKIIYAATEDDPRWSWLSYSIIKILDIRSGMQKTLTHRTRYFSPDISRDGKYIIANRISLQGVSSLVLLNAVNGNVIKEIASNHITYFVNPKIIDNNTAFAVLRNADATTCIGKINLATGDIENITPPSLTLTGYIDVKDNNIFFTAGEHLKDEVFCYHLTDKTLLKLKTPGVGSYFPNSDFDKITWSSFTADGYQLQQINTKDADWQEVSMQQLTNAAPGILSDTSQFHEVATRAVQKQYTSKSYSKFTHPFNFHSWRPNYTDPEFSFTVYGNNVLNTLQTQVYYLYNQNDRTNAVGGSILYGGIFPYINLGTTYIFNRRGTASKKIKQWNEWDNYAGLHIPLSWASGRTYKSFNVGSNYYYRTDFNTGINKSAFRELEFSYLAHGISWQQQVAMATQDIYPRFGYSANLQFRHTLNVYKSWQAFSSLNLYLPGIAFSHSLVLAGTFQYSGSTDRVFGNRLPFARGYDAADSAGAYTVAANYHFPICYPDWGFANIFYLQRVRGNLFYDYSLAFNKNNTQRSNVQSTGAEIYFDTKWWNDYTVTLGLRGGYLLTPVPGMPRKFFFEFLLPTSLIPR